MKATRTYRPEGGSVKATDPDKLTQEHLWNLWRWGDNEKIDAPSFAASIPMRQALKSRTAKLAASKRSGRLIITATI